MSSLNSLLKELQEVIGAAKKRIRDSKTCCKCKKELIDAQRLVCGAVICLDCVKGIYWQKYAKCPAAGCDHRLNHKSLFKPVDSSDLRSETSSRLTLASKLVKEVAQAIARLEATRLSDAQDSFMPDRDEFTGDSQHDR
ncbi:hypothetical protein HDE_08058 [Halotydeus destructor]|nr:hypothetical protein HDE_08058 [Halotydeus destructor]